MKIAVSSNGPDLDSVVDPRFGRCAYLVIVDTENMQHEAVSNPNVGAGGGAGISTAQMVVDKGAQAVLTGNVGPNAFGVLDQAGISVYTGISGTVRQAAERFKAGGMSSTTSPTVGGHFGTQPPAVSPGAAGPGPSPFYPGSIVGPGYPGAGMGPGGGWGGGRGRCGGRGGGRRW